MLTVLWLAAGLSAIVFTVANTVRGETERATNAVDDVRAYYLATGAVERLYPLGAGEARGLQQLIAQERAVHGAVEGPLRA